MLRVLPDECVDLIYLDPPFNSNHNYVAVFGDKGRVDAQLRDIFRWAVETENAYRQLQRGPLLNAIDGIRLITGEQSKMAAYAVFMGRRLAQMHRVLKPTGSIYLHCDHHAMVFLRILLNAVFVGEQLNNPYFRNEIVWCYTGPGSPYLRHFNRKHDTVFWYTKGKKWKFNKDDIRIPHKALNTNRSGAMIADAMTEDLRDEYLAKGKLPEDYWLEDRDGMTPVGRKPSENIGYSTQKPIALLERIIKASSDPDDLVMDPFCGCGTAADAAAKLGRKYMGIDISGIAVRVMEQRLTSRGGDVAPVVYGLGWSDYEWEQFEKRALQSRDDTEDGIPGWAWAEDKVAGLLNAVPNDRKTGDGGVDARFYGAAKEVIPIQVKMHRNRIGRPDMDKLLGAQTAMQNRGVFSPMSIMVSLYPPPHNLRTFAAEQGRVILDAGADGVSDYPVMQVLSVQEMLTKGELPKLPPPDPRSLVGNSQTRLAIS